MQRRSNTGRKENSKKFSAPNKGKDTRTDKPTGTDKPTRTYKSTGTDKSTRTYKPTKTYKKSDDKKLNDEKPSVQKPRAQKSSNSSEGTRLNKYIANAGVCSRREADTFISTGLVSINGKIITELGTKVMMGDEVKFNGEKINPEKKVYILLNKPKGFVTTVDDPEGRRTVMELVADACAERVYPVGRLDRNTTGLLLLTNDGDLTKKLTHPSHNKKKIYHVELDQEITPEQIEIIKNGIELEDGLIAADNISYVNENKKEIGIELHSGRNRIVRRIMEHFGYNVKRLDRVFFAGLTKVNLTRGRWRILSSQEIIRLQTGMYE